MKNTNIKLYPELQKVINGLNPEGISTERKAVLQPLIDFIASKIATNEPIRLNFICTHNSRRSHLSQVWAQTMAHYFGVKQVICYSGGTEATALFPMVSQTLEAQGFTISKLSTQDNPVYAIKFAANEQPVLGFSKTYDDSFNPTADFAAIMTCSQADAGCPFIAGAAKRIPITYEDPKVFDGTPEQAKKYKERSLQIATELYYVFATLKDNQ